MVTVSPLKRDLTVDPNEPRPSSSSLMIHSSLKNLGGKDRWEVILSLEEQIKF